MKKSTHFACGNTYFSVLHTRIRKKCSALKEDLYSANLISNPNYICGYPKENAEHFWLFCNRFIIYRNKILYDLFVSYGYRFCIFLRFFYGILELFQQPSIFLFFILFVSNKPRPSFYLYISTQYFKNYVYIIIF